jgi:hypothetical protein
MAKIDEVVYCKNCGVEITWAPVVKAGRHYCCQDCYDGRPCDCGYQMELDDERRTGSGSDLVIS